MRKEDGDVVELVWTRENMGLSDRDFKGDVETCKDLEGVWKEFGLGGSEQEEGSEEMRNREGAKRTILLDDEPSKAVRYSIFFTSLADSLIVGLGFENAGSTTFLSPPYQTIHSSTFRFPTSPNFPTQISY